MVTTESYQSSGGLHPQHDAAPANEATAARPRRWLRRLLGGTAVVAAAGSAVYLGPVRSWLHHRDEVAGQLAVSYKVLERDFGVSDAAGLPFVLHAHGLDNQTATPKAAAFSRYSFDVANPGQFNVYLQDLIKVDIQSQPYNVSGRNTQVPLQSAPALECDASSGPIASRQSWDAEIGRLSAPIEPSQGCINMLEHQIQQPPQAGAKG